MNIPNEYISKTEDVADQVGFKSKNILPIEEPQTGTKQVLKLRMEKKRLPKSLGNN